MSNRGSGRAEEGPSAGRPHAPPAEWVADFRADFPAVVAAVQWGKGYLDPSGATIQPNPQEAETAGRWIVANECDSSDRVWNEALDAYCDARERSGSTKAVWLGAIEAYVLAIEVEFAAYMVEEGIKPGAKDDQGDVEFFRSQPPAMRARLERVAR